MGAIKDDFEVLEEKGQDPNSEKAQISTLLHVIFALVSFASIAIASILLSKACEDPGLSATVLGQNQKSLYGVAIFVCVCLAAMILGRIARIFGLAERLFYFAFFVWLFLFASLIAIV